MKREISTVVTALCCVLAPQVGPTAAATERPGTSSTAGRVVIECKATVSKQVPAPARGPCAVSGAIRDRGRFVDNDLLGARPHIRTLFGAKGTIRMSVSRAQGGWAVIEGTKAYDDLGGRGWESRSWRGCLGPPNGRCDVYLTMAGTVSQ